MEIKRLKQEAKELLFKDGQKQVLEFFKNWDIENNSICVGLYNSIYSWS